MDFGLKDLPQSKWGSGTGRQVILKGDFAKTQAAILQVAALMPPPIPEWVDATEIKVPATPDSPAQVMMSGFPNILHPGMVGGGLTDGRYRENTAEVTLDFDLSARLWGAEKADQWYLHYALAGNADEHFTLKAMPYMRVKSHDSGVISLGNLVTPDTTGIGYGFTTDELIDGLIYVHTGPSRGLVRTITANNNDNSTGGTITYGGSGLTLAAGVWFVVLPPAVNFRLVGTIFNNSDGNIVKFDRQGNWVDWLAPVLISRASLNTAVENVHIACPLATALRSTHRVPALLAHPDSVLSEDGSGILSPYGGVSGAGPYATNYMAATIESPIRFCRHKAYPPGGAANDHFAIGYGYPPNRGF